MHLVLNILWLLNFKYKTPIHSLKLIHTNFSFRNEAQEEGSQEVQILSVAPVVFSETRPHTCGLGRGLSESSIQEPLRKDSIADSVLTFHSPEVKECKM